MVFVGRYAVSVREKLIGAGITGDEYFFKVRAIGPTAKQITAWTASCATGSGELFAAV